MSDTYSKSSDLEHRQRPLYRVIVKHKTGDRDRDGKEIFGAAREIGAVWNRPDGKWHRVQTDIPISTADFLIYLEPVKID